LFSKTTRKSHSKESWFAS